MVIPSDNQLIEDIGKMMDQAKLNPGYIQGTKAPIAVIVSNVRTELTRQFIEYIKGIESKPKHIEVQTDPEAPMQ